MFFIIIVINWWSFTKKCTKYSNKNVSQIKYLGNITEFPFIL